MSYEGQVYANEEIFEQKDRRLVGLLDRRIAFCPQGEKDRRLVDLLDRHTVPCSEGV